MAVRGVWAAVALVAGWGFIGVGLFVWSRNPGNRVGSLMAATGFAWTSADFIPHTNAPDRAARTRLAATGPRFATFSSSSTIARCVTCAAGPWCSGAACLRRLRAVSP